MLIHRTVAVCAWLLPSTSGAPAAVEIEDRCYSCRVPPTRAPSCRSFQPPQCLTIPQPNVRPFRAVTSLVIQRFSGGLKT
ncbi:hypothetical protein P692DRAFT_20449871 [Suillus brevipes Sb2]|nr:hypothetical protein P692DRAFT_20449871 [Suillus brevipes Sb2]